MSGFYRSFFLLIKQRGKCDWCKISVHQGGPLTLQLHHVRGREAGDTEFNLRLLCANCHSMTANWCRSTLDTTNYIGIDPTPASPYRPVIRLDPKTGGLEAINSVLGCNYTWARICNMYFVIQNDENGNPFILRPSVKKPRPCFWKPEYKGRSYRFLQDVLRVAISFTEC